MCALAPQRHTPITQAHRPPWPQRLPELRPVRRNYDVGVSLGVGGCIPLVSRASHFCLQQLGRLSE